LSDFLAPLTGESQQFNNASVSATSPPGSENDLGEFLILQNAVTGDDLRGQWHASAGD
jgi:hypothetical protein